MTEEEKVLKRKGFRSENCYRAACENAGAYFYNKGTRKYYCLSCARRINEAYRMYNPKATDCLCYLE